MAGRPRTSAAILKLRGTFIHDPQRAREDAPGAGPFDPEPPDGLTGPEIAAWREIVAALPRIALTASERPGLIQVARLWATLRQTNPASPDFVKLDAAFCRWCVQMGMTLQARAKLGTSGKQDGKANKFSGLKGEPSAG